ncbi:hypothetical protein KCP73_26785 (plasmid) [Salmonella enterica subsp. enterica]|nr:hypothetical protein KCP73_26785 [Salmonella enterica subsp. enterica]
MLVNISHGSFAEACFSSFCRWADNHPSGTLVLRPLFPFMKIKWHEHRAYSARQAILLPDIPLALPRTSVIFSHSSSCSRQN